VIIQHLKLNQFRNYQNADVQLSSGLNFFYGDNAQGKTNLLESVYVAAYGKSFRTNTLTDLIHTGAEHGLVELDYIKLNSQGSVRAVVSSNGQRSLFVNGQPMPKRVDYIGQIHVVLFSPEDLKLIKEGPSERRLFVDRELSHLNRVYLNHLMKYHKVLKQRNLVLKQGHQRNRLEAYLEIWDQQLAYYGARMIVKRLNFIQRLNTLARLMHKRITDGRETLEIKYESSLNLNGTDVNEIEEQLINLLHQKIDLDQKRGYTSVGPHRDDFCVWIDQIDARRYGSQGQQRTAALSIKLSELEIVKEEIGEYPILLLDDVMSELDPNRQHFLLDAIKNIQSILTLTDLKGMKPEILKEADCKHIQSGKLIGG